MSSLVHRHGARLRRRLLLAMHRAGLLRPFSFVEWLATAACDFRCPYCGVDAGRALADELDTVEAIDLVDQVRSIGGRRILISGGEPLLRPDVPEIIRKMRRRGVAPGLVTNAWRLTERVSEFSGSGFFLFLTSLDGPEDFHDAVTGRPGSWRRALAGLEWAAAAGIPERMVNTVVQPANLPHLPELAMTVRATGATRWQLSPVAREGRAAGREDLSLCGDELRNLVEFVRCRRPGLSVELGESRAYLDCLDGSPTAHSFFCGAGLTRLTVMPNGAVAGCHPLHAAGRVEGHLRNTPLATIWRQGFADLRRTLPGKGCVECRHVRLCNGGCPAELAREGSCLKPVWFGEKDRG